MGPPDTMPDNSPTRSRRWPWVRFFAGWLLTLGILYCASYVVLSIQGTYGPGAFGCNGIKWYNWYPKGFAYNGEPGDWIGAVYGPLLALDRAMWHTRARQASGAYRSSDFCPW